MSTPAEALIEKCGGHAEVAKICGVHVTRVYRWTYAREKGGTDGVIPTRHQAQLLKGARERGIDLTPADFFAAEVASSVNADSTPAPAETSGAAA